MRLSTPCDVAQGDRLLPCGQLAELIEYVRRRVNLLTSEEHLKELMCQLQLIGEVILIVQAP